MDRWVNRVALVTGASAGIGAAACRELVKQGMIVVGCARSVHKIESIVTEIEMQDYPGKLHAIKCDMSKEGDILVMYDEIRRKFGRLDVCINNAVTNIDSSLLTGDSSYWRYMLEVGILGVCINTREAIKLMKESDVTDGQIIHMGSVVGHKLPSYRTFADGKPNPCFHIYNGIKSMIRVLAEGLRQELRAIGSNIRVAVISPGATETEIFARTVSPDVAARFYGNYKCLQAQDVAEAINLVLKAPPYANINDIILEPLDFMIQG